VIVHVVEETSRAATSGVPSAKFVNRIKILPPITAHAYSGIKLEAEEIRSLPRNSDEQSVKVLRLTSSLLFVL
jgi:hypothetical protein